MKLQVLVMMVVVMMVVVMAMMILSEARLHIWQSLPYSVLPAFRVVFLETRIEEIVVEARGGLLRHGDRLRVLLQLRHVLRRVPSLQGVQVAVASVLALPQ